MVHTRLKTLRLTALALIMLTPLGPNTANAARPQPKRWQDGFTLMLADVSTPDAARNTVEVIRGVGGRVAVFTEPNIVFGWVSPAAHKALLRAGIRAIYTGGVPLDTLALAGHHERTLAAARFLNAVASGTFFTKARPKAPGPAPSPVRLPPLSIPRLTTFDNEEMSGYVNVAMLFIESDGEEDEYTWDSTTFDDVYDTTWAALSRWASMAR